jgi:hypothetical protein
LKSGRALSKPSSTLACLCNEKYVVARL